VHDALLVGERSAEDEEAVVDEPVHEGRVLRPVGLLLERLRVVVLRPGAAKDDEEHHRGGLIVRGRLNSR
jgi:hypothetical protein